MRRSVRKRGLVLCAAAFCLALSGCGSAQAFVSSLSGLCWSTPVLLFMAGAGLWLTVRTRGILLRRIGHILHMTAGRLFHRQQAGTGEMTPFQALSTAMAGTIGTGSISGVAAAVTMGGPGALFWLWVMAFLGMATKYAEIVLSILFRRRTPDGTWQGGPMYTIRDGLGRSWRLPAGLFCVFGMLAALGLGNMVQVSCIADAVQQLFQPGETGAPVLRLAAGLAAAGIVGYTLLGGVQRLGRVTAALVPVMSIVYIAACLAVVAAHARQLGPALGLIFRTAFTPQAVLGGGAGHALRTCMSWGVRRGIFTNEAGLGSAPMAHAASSETNAVRQGFYGVFEVFADSMLLCTLTGLALLCSGLSGEGPALVYGTPAGCAEVAAAFAAVLGPRLAGMVIAVCIALFALSTLLGWALYGGRCCAYLFGDRAAQAFQFFFAAACIPGAVLQAQLVWEASDIVNALMALTNLAAVLALSGRVARATRDYFSRLDRQKKETRIFH